MKNQPQIYLEWKDATVSVHNKIIIKNITGFAKPGELVAILGPSGAGKTTLLNFIAQRFSRSSELVIDHKSLNMANGLKYDIESFKKFGGYVEQDDALWCASNPLELFEFACKLRTNLDQDQIKIEVDEMIDLLGLHECKYTPAGGKVIRGMSTGEKRRTSIGYELITRPLVCILDEPTSGLDSHNAFNVMKYIRNTA